LSGNGLKVEALVMSAACGSANGHPELPVGQIG
jgi:hypothetical protein